MNMLEALKEARKTGKWARPTQLGNTPFGYTWRGDMVVTVPDAHGGRRAEIPIENILFRAWEVVEPDTLYAAWEAEELAERQRYEREGWQ